MSFRSDLPTHHYEKQTLASGTNFKIEVVVKDDYTHSIQISHIPSKQILQAIPFDPTDNMLAATINEHTLEVLGEEANHALSCLSDILRSQIGAKELMILPSTHHLPGYSAPENSGSPCPRLRHCTLQQLQKQTASVCAEYPDLTRHLDRHYHFVAGAQNILLDHSPSERFQEMGALLEETNFIPSKMGEYKNEGLTGKMSRLNSVHIQPIAMLDHQGNMVGMIRALAMGNGFSYLADEIVMQRILPLEQFPGSSAKEQVENRHRFLLAYLMNHASELLSQYHQHHFIIIAARDGADKTTGIDIERTKIYDAIGYEKFPLNIPGFKAVINFDLPKPLLETIKKKIKELPLPSETQRSDQNVSHTNPSSVSCYLRYGKWMAGAALLGVAGLFAYRFLSKGDTTAINTASLKINPPSSNR